MAKDARELLCEMQTLWRIFNRCRGHFPCTPEECVGEKVLSSPAYYHQQGIDITFCFEHPLSRERVDEINRIGHWLNQNFVVRLYALLESYEVLSNKQSIDSNLDGSKELDLVRRLRQRFAHSSGRYNPKEHRTLVQKIGSVLGQDFANCCEFPLGIKEVLEPLFEGCRRYVVEWAGLSM